MTHEYGKRTNQIDTEKLTAWYNFQAPFFHFWRDQYEDPLISRIAELIDGEASENILDAGCGSGLYSIGLGLLKSNWQITGIDYSKSLLQIAQKQATKKGLPTVTFTNANVMLLPFRTAHYSTIIAAGLFPNINDRDQALREIHRVLQDQGKLIIVEFNREGLDWKTMLFFRIMITGYHAFTTVFRQFRFANKWDITTSTIDKNEFEDLILRSGFTICQVVKEFNHIIFLCRKA